MELVGVPSGKVPLADPLVVARNLKFISESQIPGRLDGPSLHSSILAIRHRAGRLLVLR
jgi:hypothetical protein